MIPPYEYGLPRSAAPKNILYGVSHPIVRSYEGIATNFAPATSNNGRCARLGQHESVNRIMHVETITARPRVVPR